MVFVSAYTTEELRRQGRLPPKGRALQKPFGANALLDAVRKALAGDQARAQA